MRRLDVCIGEIRLRALDMEIIWLCVCVLSLCLWVFCYFVYCFTDFFSSGVLFLQYAGVE